MLKRRKFPFRNQRLDSSDSDDNIIVETPTNENNLRLLLSNYTHNSHFLFQTIVSKYDIHPPRNELNLSLQPHHEIYRPDVTPQIFRTNRSMLEESPVHNTNQQDLSQILKTTATSISPSRRNGRVLNPMALPARPITLKAPPNKKLRDIVRRKSCHCRDCGGLTKLEKKALHLPPEPRKLKLTDSPSHASTPKLGSKSPQNASRSPIKHKTMERRRGSLVPKKPENDDFLSLPLSDMPTRVRNKTYDVSRITISRTASQAASSIERIDEEAGPKKYLDIKVDRNSSRKTSSGRKSDKSFDKSLKQEKSGKNLNSTDAFGPKIVTTKAKKIYVKHSTPGKQRVAPSNSCANQSMKVYNSETKLSASQESLKKNFVSEKLNGETMHKKALSGTISKDVLKKMLHGSEKEIKPIKVLPSEKIYRAAPFELSSVKSKRRQNNESMAEKRALSLPRLPKDASGIIQNNEVNDSLIKEKNESRERVPKIQIHSKPPLWMQTYKRESQTSRELRISIMKGDTPSESFIKNIKSSLEDNKLADSPTKKIKNKIAYPVWKNGIGTAFPTYKVLVQKHKRASGSQSYRSNSDLISVIE